MPELTDERLAEIEARRMAATPGPWEASHTFVRTPCPSYMTICNVNRPIVANLAVGKTIEDCRAALDANRDFIAHSPQDMGDLLGEVRRLRLLLAGCEKGR